jgi:hypothetical protein
LLQSFAIAARSSAVADFYATKYLAKPQQWPTSALGPLIAGFRKAEEEQKQAEERASATTLSLRKLRTAFVAANRSVWISSCEACLFLETGGSAVLSHRDVAVHGRKGLFMMNECKRILNKEVVGEGLWQTDLAKCEAQQAGDVLEIQAADVTLKGEGSDNKDEDCEIVGPGGATEHSDGEDIDVDAEVVGAAEHSDCEDIDADADMVGATEHSDGEAADADADIVGATEHSEAEQETNNPEANDKAQEDEAKDTTPMTGATEHGGDEDNAVDQKKANAQIFQITISLRDDWLHRV